MISNLIILLIILSLIMHPNYVSEDIRIKEINIE